MQLNSWGMYPQIKSKKFTFNTKDNLRNILEENSTFIPFGNGRSYGDSALAENIIYSKPYNYFLDFDEDLGILHCQSGVMLSEIIEAFVPRGWFLKVTPGTKLITIGGAIASDVHGKNHHVEGCFSSCVEEFTLILPNGEIKNVKKDDELFLATCGGMGLTGVILDAKISLKKINSKYINQTTIKTKNLKETFEEYEKVISTIPLPLVAKIAPDLPKDIHEKYSSKINIGCVCVIVKLNKPLTNNFWLNTNDENMDIPGIIEYSNLNSEVGNIVYVPYYMPQTNSKFNDSDEIFKEKVSKYFKTINPSLKDDDIKDIRVHRYYFSQPICQPNFMDTLPDAKIPLDGLWIADTSHYYPEDRGISESIGYGRDLVKRVISDS